jgi:acyl carrier protein
MLQRLLHLRREAIDVEASFAQMGLDSISGVEFVRDLNKRFGLSLEAEELYDHA